MSAFSDTITNTIGKYVPAIRRKPKIDKRQALAIIPMRHPLINWERKEKEVILTIPVRNDALAKIVKKIVKKLPESRQVGLDEVGSVVWEMCDGERDINSIVLAVAKETKLTRREAEASVTMFLQTLAKKNLIGLMSAGGKSSVKRKGS